MSEQGLQAGTEQESTDEYGSKMLGFIRTKRNKKRRSFALPVSA